jgi:PAP2 superfamily
VTRLLEVAPSRRDAAALGVLAAGYAALSVLVAAGAFTRIDQFALDHLMMHFVPSPRGNGFSGLYAPYTGHPSTAGKILDVFTYPCSALLSGGAVVAAAVVLRRRGGWLPGLALAAAWVAGNAIEEVGKHLLTRPALDVTVGGERLHVIGFDDSFPSGHMIRCLLVCAALVLVWRRLAPWVAAWGACVGPALVVQDSHTITDVVGGMLVGAMLLVSLRASTGRLLNGSGTDIRDRSSGSPSGRTERDR